MTVLGGFNHPKLYQSVDFSKIIFGCRFLPESASKQNPAHLERFGKNLQGKIIFLTERKTLFDNKQRLPASQPAHLERRGRLFPFAIVSDNAEIVKKEVPKHGCLAKKPLTTSG